MIRSIRPVELFALASFNALAGPNEAQSRNSLGRKEARPLTIPDLLKKWLSLEENRHTWVSVDAGPIKGLISARNRSGPSAWDVDCLLLEPQTAPEEVCTELLEHLCGIGAEKGIERVFLRLSHQSIIQDAARRVGFHPLLQETLYSLEPKQRNKLGQPNLNHPLRPRSGADDLGLFQLYSATVLCTVRQMEGATLREWKETRECLPNGRRREFVYQPAHEILGWVQICLDDDRAYIDLLCHPQEEKALVSLLGFGLACLPPRCSALCLVPDFQIVWQRLAEEWGFEVRGQYQTLIRQLSVRIKQPRLVPIRV